MANRRDVLGMVAGALGGAVFTGCGWQRAAFAQAGIGAQPHHRREVVVNGKRVKTVDVHAHCHIPEALELIGRKVQSPGWWWGRTASRRWTSRASMSRR
jgi:aminocarboxymuconate-semialdehyde decarboxylase